MDEKRFIKIYIIDQPSVWRIKESMEKSEIMQAAQHAYYVSASMIKFLLVENLALKTLLHQKGLITPEEYKTYQEQAGDILSMKEEKQMLLYFEKVITQTASVDTQEVATHKSQNRQIPD